MAHAEPISAATAECPEPAGLSWSCQAGAPAAVNLGNYHFTLAGIVNLLSKGCFNDVSAASLPCPLLLFLPEVPLNACASQRDTPCAPGSSPWIVLQDPAAPEKPMGIQVHQGEGSSSQNRKNLHRTETWSSHQPIACTLQEQSFCGRSILTFLMRAMKINQTASAFGLFLALVAFAGTVILHFSNLMSFSCSEWWCCDTQSKTAPTHHGICLLSECQIHTLCCLVLTKHNISTWAVFPQYCFEEQWVPGEIWEFKRKAEGG